MGEELVRLVLLMADFLKLGLANQAVRGCLRMGSSYVVRDQISPCPGRRSKSSSEEPAAWP